MLNHHSQNFGLSANDVKEVFIKKFCVLVEIAQFFIWEKNHKKSSRMPKKHTIDLLRIGNIYMMSHAKQKGI